MLLLISVLSPQFDTFSTLTTITATMKATNQLIPYLFLILPSVIQKKSAHLVYFYMLNSKVHTTFPLKCYYIVPFVLLLLTSPFITHESQFMNLFFSPQTTWTKVRENGWVTTWLNTMALCWWSVMTLHFCPLLRTLLRK